MGITAASEAARAATRAVFGEVANGGTVSYIVPNQAPIPIDGVFRSAAQMLELSPDGGPGVRTNKPMLSNVETSWLPDFEPTHRIQLRNATWAIIDRVENGLGGVVFYLTRVPQ